MRHVRKAQMIAHRGTIVDRFGEPLAVSSAGGFGVGQPARVRGFGRRHREALAARSS